MIPKIINYCWMGGKPKPLKIQQCIQSWKDIMPDYEIIEWNESNFNIDIYPYVREAYNKKMYAFVNDYIRLWCLYNFGGLFLDADVEVLKPLDRFLTHRCFTGHENDTLLVTATMGSEKNHPWIKMLLDWYKDGKFEKVPNTWLITTLSQPWIEKKENGFTYLKEDVIIYPIEYFDPYDWGFINTPITENTYTIHHFMGSWSKC
jgi:mannosyltransferase OCH1-like enzyme